MKKQSGNSIRYGLGLIFKGLSAIVFLAIVVFVFFIHPNDSRISLDLPKYSSGTKEKHYKKSASLWQGNLEFRLDGMISRKAYIESAEKLWPTTILWSLARFHHENQAYVTVGRYPYNLEGRDALFIPPNGTLVLKAAGKFKGKLDFGVSQVFPSGNLLIKSTQGRILAEVKQESPQFLLKALKFISPWLFPEILKSTPRWADLELELSGKDDLSFQCTETVFGCFISGLNVYEETSAPLKQTIMILVDTLRFDGIDERKSPALSEFRNQSVIYENAVSPGNMTSPSTNALLSCTPPTHLGNWAFSYGVNGEQRDEFFRRGFKSFPQVLSDNGIKTAMIGNISVVSEVMGVGQNHGFESQLSIEFDGYDTPLITAEAINWIARNKDRDFLLYVHYNAPHAPHRPPFKDISRAWSGITVFKSYVHILDWLYNAEISYIDRYFYFLISFLKNEGWYKGLNIVLTSDHGDQMRPRSFNGNEWGPSFTGTYHDHGATLLNDEVRVPLLVKNADQEDSYVVEDFVSTLQLGPSIVNQLLGPSDLSCFLPALPSITKNAKQNELVLPIEGFRERAIISQGRYKYIRAYEPTIKRVHPAQGFGSSKRPYFVKERIYDLKSDPQESFDLKEKNIDLLKELRSLYRKAFKIENGYELTFDLKDKANIRVLFKNQALFSGRLPSELEFSGQEIISKNPISGRFSVALKGVYEEPPLVLIDELPIKLTYTKERIPLENPKIEILPFEDPGEDNLLPPNLRTMVSLRRIWDPNREELGIKVTNPEFEKMLQEWGYLNDN